MTRATSQVSESDRQSLQANATSGLPEKSNGLCVPRDVRSPLVSLTITLSGNILHIQKVDGKIQDSIVLIIQKLEVDINWRFNRYLSTS